MKPHYLQLDYIINVDNFQSIQDTMSLATGMAMITVDYKGMPITTHSKCSSFCEEIRKNPQYNHLCYKCDSRGGLEATRLMAPYIYKCHVGIVDVAIPISVEGHYIGAIMAGQVLLEEQDNQWMLEQIVAENPVTKAQIMEELEEAYDQIPKMSYEKVKAVADMIFQISNYIVEEALLKIKLNESNENNTTYVYYDKLSVLGSDPQGIEDKKVNHQNEINVVLNPLAQQNLEQDNIILRPSIYYIQENYHKQITLNEMAALCNISTSYYSKLFKKVIGEHFSNYINKIRIQQAKQLLSSTDIPILNLSLDLGFEECSYFIKVFKKMEGMTPSAYRNQFKK